MPEMNSRQQFILQQVIERGRVAVVELANLTGVSEVTIRHDLNLLEQRHYLQRRHGYAEPVDNEDLETRMMSHYPVKLRLAEFAAAKIKSGETVFIENGSCNALLAQILSARADIKLVTVSGYIARHLTHSAAEVILLGGHYQQRSETTVGPLTLRYLNEIDFDRAFIGVDGWRHESGFTGRDAKRSEVVNALLCMDKEVVVLTDSSKFGASFPCSLGRAGGITRVITDSGIPEEAKIALRAQGIMLDVVDEPDIETQN
ncbi:DeoR family transcriptional regulator [Salmonella enterica subsp. enterica serovar Choleraesuis]|nr:DeoR family transcriptional regulator [Salmonella enterica subsp. enterica serovar Choleraesuis]